MTLSYIHTYCTCSVDRASFSTGLLCSNKPAILQVDDLMKKVAEENGLDVLDKLKEAQVGQTLPSGTVQEDEALTRRSASNKQCI